MPMSQIGRMFEGATQRSKERWYQTRLIAWEVNKQYHKHPVDIDKYLPLDEVEDKTKASQEHLDEIWKKYDNIPKRSRKWQNKN